jgi:hypothetical protein
VAQSHSKRCAHGLGERPSKIHFSHGID